jgi:hypothetical protein
MGIFIASIVVILLLYVGIITPFKTKVYCGFFDETFHSAAFDEEILKPHEIVPIEKGAI